VPFQSLRKGEEFIPSAAGEILHPQMASENVSRETFRDFVAQLISWILES
jgi:hypothetical protein